MASPIMEDSLLKVGPPEASVPSSGWSVLVMKNGVVQSTHKVKTVSSS